MSKIKEIFGTIFGWFRKNWLLLLVIISLVALFLKGCDQSNVYDNLFERFQEQSKDHNRQIKELRLLQEEEREEMSRLMQQYTNEINRIEHEYKEELGRIANFRETTRTRIVENHGRDPNTLTVVVRDTFGIPIE